MIASIGRGLAILVGVRRGDCQADAESLAEKVYGLRIFGDDQRKMNLSAKEVDGQFLAVSQFTLYADTSRGRRPSFIQAADGETARAVYERFVARLRELGGQVETGAFGVYMLVDIANDGPVTIVLDSEARA